MAAGSVSISDAGVETKSGSAGRLYDLLKAMHAANMPNSVIPTGSEGVPIQRGLADMANTFASWHDTETLSHTKTEVLTSDVSLQRTPDPNDPNTNTLGPAATRLLGLRHTV